MLKKLLFVACLSALANAPVIAESADVFVRRAPPPPRHEVVPEPRRGHVWAPGHWDYRNGRYVWVAGHWVRERRGYSYREPVWEERDGRWHMRRGGWARGDRDHDGVPNRVDRDRDGDGVPNRYDDRPNNPRRY